MLEVAADFLTNCAFWDMQMRSLARFSDFLGQVPEDYSTDTLEKFPSMISFCNTILQYNSNIHIANLASITIFLKHTH